LVFEVIGIPLILAEFLALSMALPRASTIIMKRKADRRTNVNKNKKGSCGKTFTYPIDPIQVKAKLQQDILTKISLISVIRLSRISFQNIPESFLCLRVNYLLNQDKIICNLLTCYKPSMFLKN